MNKSIYSYKDDLKFLAEKASNELMSIEKHLGKMFEDIERRQNYYGELYPGWQSKHRSAAYRKSLDLSDTLVELRRALYGKEK